VDVSGCVQPAACLRNTVECGTLAYILAMKFSYLFLVLFFPYLGASSNNTGIHSDSTLKTVALVVSYPIPQRGNLSFVLRDTLQIFNYGNYVLYAMPHTSVYQEGLNISRQQSDYLYFLYKKASVYGFEFPSLTDTVGNRRSIKDDYLSHRAFASVQLPTDHSQYDSLIMTDNHLPGTLVEQFIVKKKQKGQYFDTSYYYYSTRMNDAPYSLSPGLDSLKRMKLYKARFIFAPGFSEKDNIAFPTRDFFYELIPSSAALSMKSAVVAFIDKFGRTMHFD
jgi:hypothetical protein